MQLLAFHLLAADDDFPTKGVFIIIAVAIWIITSIASSVRKATAKTQVQKEQAQLRAVRQAMQSPAPVQARPRVAQRRAPVAPPPIKRLFQRRPPPIPNRPPQAPPREPEPVMMQLAEAPPPRTQAAQRVVARSATAASLNRWLNPKTLQQQFMLTEVFQPPVTLRESHLSAAGL
jgi:hypothetical protein